MRETAPPRHPLPHTEHADPQRRAVTLAVVNYVRVATNMKRFVA